ncbi:MAG: hypothetical protein ACLGH4_06745 [Actinomycetes bacterium]
MAATEHQRRRFVTRHDVEDAAAAGRSVVLTGRDTLTDEAAQRAMDLGVAIEREGAVGRAVRPSSGAGATSTGPGAGASGDQLRRAVRAAVVAELGHEPAGLDAAIDRVLARRR